jgi:hypothetical protein
MKKDISLLDWNTPDIPMLQANHTWVLPQVLAFFNSVVRLERVDGKISSSATLRALHADLLESRVRFQSGRVLGSGELSGLFAYINHSPRGEILYGKQSAPTCARYGAAVPLLLSAFKELRNVPYGAWDYTDPKITAFLDKDTAAVVPHIGQEFPDLDLVEIRELGRTVKSGARAGRQTPYVSCTSINGIPDPDFRALPRLVKLMLCQVWLYHPTVRHPLAWTNLLDLDSPAPSLVDTEILDEPETRGRKAKPEPEPLKLPWQ